MTWRIRVRHSSGFRYAEPVQASYNEARITPQSTPSQITLASAVDILPAAPPYRYWDYWGTLVHAFEVNTPHQELTVVGTSTVETSDVDGPDESTGWDSVEGEHDRLAEYLAPSTYVPAHEDITAWASTFRQSAPVPTVASVLEGIGDRLDYVKGVTRVSTSALEVFHHGKGVCQDFAHLSLGALRTVGIPARYVSGYLYPVASATVGQSVVGESHAWIEAWLGDWYAYDPTNGSRVGQRHVLVARGRDYRDVSPLRGVYSGRRAEKLAVSVELTRTG